MKYENLKEVNRISEQIAKYDGILDQLRASDVSVRIDQPNYSTVMTIGTWASCEHDCRNYAAQFVDNLISHYETKVSNLHAKLEVL